MDVIEFTEKVCGVKLFEYQKVFLRKMDALRSKGKIYILPRRTGGSYIYIDDTMRKELIPNGEKNAVKQ